MSNKDKVIMYESPEAATYMTGIKGWVDINRRYFGDNEDGERMARFSSCTHKKCDCGGLMERIWTKCENCRGKAAIERYNSLPFEEWDLVKPVCEAFGYKYFFSEEEITDFIYEHNEDCDEEDKITELDLLICEPNSLQHLHSSYWEDVLFEDNDIPKKLQDAVDAVNKVIDTLPPQSYSPGKIRTTYKYTEQ
jgi:hypothetical protein